jgi:hypothetical protein
MAEGKKSFVLYADYIKILNHLEDEEVGIVMRWIFEYVNDNHPEPLPRLLMAIIEPIISQLKRDLDKWDVTREGRSKAGKASAEARRIKKEQDVTNPTSVESVEENPTNPTVTEYGTVTVDDTVDVVDTVKKESTLLCSISSKHELDNDIDRITFAFWELFKKNLTEAGVNKTTTLDKAKLETWRNPIRLAIDTDERTREEFEEVFKFLQKNEFWKKNIQSTTKLREQFERLLVEARTKPTKTPHGEVPDDIKQQMQEIAERRRKGYDKPN